ncbi:hypothetical protein DSM106972_091880 [Dulcicalothrix desertica PCC 7102]|uniref:Pentapeptide repeat protein n=1 Tax=Dulcicalothrix desertica PCC 7102 TaxID=232991 RepID=A0A3S1C431_9CYAN|nr:pentapeptide repeat-containing protein [Dulcicalothrix desertica]RUS94937.1 hypothetical protein DSM106972_091880 [Dulcicalothrix desertica PCC 7102]
MIGIWFIKTDLKEAILRQAILIGANFSGADLCDADLTITQALETNFIAATLAGACIDDVREHPLLADRLF